ncbi:hypothetical protein RHRU231_440006 [Rhodococcus ruber]|uniref:Uncharacterized protein n=1 Tax=Rhodococcus ruber TaxID=1830 RepID=A0A098BKS2_9NOCA|nr:hypothetical protein RHRU231_440006 [Rhodococcus ruber]
MSPMPAARTASLTSGLLLTTAPPMSLLGGGFRGDPLDDGLQIARKQFGEEDRRDAVVTVEDDGGGDDRRRVVRSQRQQRAHRRVVDRRVADPVVDDEVLGLVALVVADVDAEELHALVLGGLVDLFEVVGLATARGAPLAPHVEHHHLAGVVVERDRLALVHQVLPRERPEGAALGGRVVEDAGLTARRDEVEGAAGGDGVVAGGARGEDAAGQRRRRQRRPSRGPATHAPWTVGSEAPAGSE